MQMLQRIKNNSVLAQFIEEECCENGVCVTFDRDIDRESYIIIKVDKYYNSLTIEDRPASVDCLIIRKCEKSGFGLTLVELKSNKNSKNIDLSNIKEKYHTTLYDFIEKRFKEELRVAFNDVKLYFVSNIELYRRDLGLKMDVLINTRFRYSGKTLMIHPMMPNPTIKKCY